MCAENITVSFVVKMGRDGGGKRGVDDRCVWDSTLLCC